VIHSSVLHGCRISYWRDGENNSIAAEPDTATSVCVVPCGKHYPEFKFDLPEQRSDFDKLVHLMHAVAESADYNARLEIRNALGVERPRR
jgi:hypothetical protein